MENAATSVATTPINDGQLAAAPVPPKKETYSVACYTFLADTNRTGLLGISLPDGHRFNVERHVVVVSKSLLCPHVEPLGQRGKNLLRCDFQGPVVPGSKPGLMVLLDSTKQGWPMSVRFPMPKERWDAWRDSERITDRDERKAKKNQIRDTYPVDLDIKKGGCAFMLPLPVNGKMPSNFTSALLKMDEGASIEVNLHSMDRGANCLRLECSDGRLIVSDPRTAVETIEVQEQLS